MQIIPLLLSSLIVFSGVILGIILVRWAPEEQQPGTKYFVQAAHGLLFLILALFLFSTSFSVFITGGLLAIVLVVLLKTTFTPLHATMSYLAASLILVASAPFTPLFLIESVLIMLYGMVTASLLYGAARKNTLRVVGRLSVFFIPIAGKLIQEALLTTSLF